MGNLTIRLAVAVLTLALAASCSSPVKPEKTMGENGNEQGIPLLDYLHKLGDASDCFFTIEESWAQGEPMNSLASYVVPDEAMKGESRDQLQKLAALVPNLTFQVDADTPRIIHIIDRRLAGLGSYSMVQTVRSIDFTGKTNDLVAELSRQGIQIAPQTSFVIGDPLAMRVDVTTVVHVKGDHLTVRSAISNFIPLDNYSRIIWIATTERRAGSITYINMRGPRSFKEQH